MGPSLNARLANAGAFDLGFVSMPLIFHQIPYGPFFGFIWFLLLFFAGITSSVAMGQPLISFLEEEFKMTRKKATTILAIVVVISVQFVIFFLRYGFLDEMDYWAGTFGLVLFALIETILFMWVFGADKAWDEMNRGGEIKIPRIFLFVMKFVTPVILATILLWWLVKDAIPIFMLKGVPAENVPYIWGARILMLVLLGSLIWLVKAAWKRRLGN